MSPDVIATIVDSGIPIAGGIYAKLLGLRIVGPRPGESLKYDQWHKNFGKVYKVLGPLLVLFGIFQMVSGLIRAS